MQFRLATVSALAGLAQAYPSYMGRVDDASLPRVDKRQDVDHSYQPRSGDGGMSSPITLLNASDDQG